MTLTLLSLSGPAAAPQLEALAALRIQVFREWPYLYAGTTEYETRYLQSYLVAQALIVVVKDGERVVGASTALPLVAHADAGGDVLQRAGLDPEQVFYFGESVLLPEYRGRGLGHHFFNEREAFARAQGFTVAAFAAVQRPSAHPARPAHYVPHDAFWAKRGFERRADLVTEFSWQDVGEPAESLKSMVFWLKTLTS